MKLSESLVDLAARIEKLEDAASAALTQNRSALERRSQEIEHTIEREAKEFESAVAEATTTVRHWWAETRASVDRQVEAMRKERKQRQSLHQVENAQLAADLAEDAAVAAVAVAKWYLNAAEYAVVDAALARAELETLTGAEVG